jgi:YD repeat-containing protein
MRRRWGILVRTTRRPSQQPLVADPVNDRLSAVAYDAPGRQAFAVRKLRIGPDDRYVVTKQIHDALGQVVKRVDYASPAALTQFDAAGVESGVVLDSADRTTTYVRDAAGRLRFEIRPDASFRESQYDALDQITEARQFAFAAPGNLPQTEAEMIALRGNAAVGDGVTRGQVHAYDAGGRVTRTVDALGNTERCEYDALGDRTRWIDKNGNASTCAYDRKGRKTAETTTPMPFKLRGEPLASPPAARVLETRFNYDAFSNMIRKIEAANFPNDASTTDFEFDTVGRPTATFYNGFYDAVTGTVERDSAAGRFRREASIVYDPMGNAVRISNRTAVDTFQHTWQTYESQGQIVHEVNALNHVTRYTYSSFGERETVTRYSVTISGTPQNGVYWTAGEIDPKLNWGHDENGDLLEDVYARMIRLACDTLGRKAAVMLPSATFYSTHMPGDASQANYFRPSPASVLDVQDAAVTRYEYNAFGDVTLKRVHANTIVEWQDTSFTYDARGRQTRSVDAAGYVTATYYDVAGNLVRQDEYTDQPGSDRITVFAYNVLRQRRRRGRPVPSSAVRDARHVHDPGRFRTRRAASARHFAGRRPARDPAKLRRSGQSGEHHGRRGPRQISRLRSCRPRHQGDAGDPK